jgi:hypothetical protein
MESADHTALQQTQTPQQGGQQTATSQAELQAQFALYQQQQQQFLQQMVRLLSWRRPSRMRERETDLVLSFQQQQPNNEQLRAMYNANLMIMQPYMVSPQHPLSTLYGHFVRP